MDQDSIKKLYGVGNCGTGKGLINSLFKTIKRFEYIDIEEDKEIINICSQTKIKDLESKHYIVLDDKTKEVKHLGERAGNPNILWGYHRNATKDTERDAIVEMANIGFKRPARVVIDRHGRLWGDNTHTLLSWMYRLGKDTRIGEIPIYIVDTRTDVKRIININDTLLNSLEDIKMAIACGVRINYYNDMGWRPVGFTWTLGDLAKNTELFI